MSDVLWAVFTLESGDIVVTLSSQKAEDGILADRSDESLLRECRNGDEDAATSLYNRYASRLRSLAGLHCKPPYTGRFDADDVVQSVFRAFFTGVQNNTYHVPANGELWALLTVLALNKIRNLVEFHSAGKRTIHQTTSSTNLDAILTNDESAATFLRITLDEQLVRLPESNRSIIRLRLIGNEIGEIAEQAGRSRRTVERVLQDFRKRLAEI